MSEIFFEKHIAHSFVALGQMWFFMHSSLGLRLKSAFFESRRILSRTGSHFQLVFLFANKNPGGFCPTVSANSNASFPRSWTILKISVTQFAKLMVDFLQNHLELLYSLVGTPWIVFFVRPYFPGISSENFKQVMMKLE